MDDVAANDYVLCYCIENNDTSTNLEMFLKYYKVSEKGLVKYINSCLQRRDWGGIFRVIERGVSKKLITSILETIIIEVKNGHYHNGVACIVKLGVSPEYLERLMDAYCEDMDLDNAFRIAKLEVSKESREKLLKVCIKRPDIDLALGVVALLDRKFTKEELDELVNIVVAKTYCLQPLQIAKLELSKESLQSLLSVYIKEAAITHVFEIAKLLKRELTIEEQNELFHACMQKNRSHDAVEVLRIFKLEITQAERDAIVSSCIKSGLFYLALEVAKLKMSEETLEIILDACMTNTNVRAVEVAFEVAKLLKRELIAEERRKLASNFYGKLYMGSCDEILKVLRLLKNEFTKEEFDHYIGYCLRSDLPDKAIEIAKLIE